MIFTMNQMAEGPVNTPSGPLKPEARFFDTTGKQKREMPGGGKAYLLPAGLQRFGFTGQQFGPAGTTPAVDWDIYTVGTAPDQFSLGSWGHNNGSNRPTFQAANGRPYEQRLYQLHVRGSGGFRTLIVPRRKGDAAPTVIQEGTTLVVTGNHATTRISENGFSYISAAKEVLTVYDDGPAESTVLACAGGPTEVVYDKIADMVTITAHGTSGDRYVVLPAGTWFAHTDELAWDAGRRAWMLRYTSGGKPGKAVAKTVA